MAPKGKSKSSKFYAKNPKSRAKKLKYDTEYQSSEERKAYRRELGKYNYKNKKSKKGDGKDASHSGNKIIGLESQKKNRSRKQTKTRGK